MNTTPSLSVTKHGLQRMSQRNLGLDQVEAVLDYGRRIETPYATIFAVGRKEVTHWATRGLDLGHLNGVLVICDRHEGAVITTYRSHNFRKLRPKRGLRTARLRSGKRVARHMRGRK